MIKRNLIAMVIIFFTNSINAQLTNATFKDAIEDCLSTNPVDGLCTSSTYGSMPDWDVSQVTNMTYAFWEKTNFNGDISEWDVGNVTSMFSMFYKAESFNGDISKWDVGNVTNMFSMFTYASSFNQSLNNWDVGNVTYMNGMFYGASSFNQSLNNWDVGNVINMDGMFWDAHSFNQSLNNWDVSNVTRMYGMFNFSNLSSSNFDSTLIGWSEQIVQPGVRLGADGIYYCNASAAKETLIDKGWEIWDVGQKCPITNANFKDTIKDCLSTNPVDGLCTSVKYGSMPEWDVSQVTDMSYAFAHRTSFNADISEWDVSNVTDMSVMFYEAKSFNQSLNNWDVRKVINMDGMFAGATTFNADISDWDVSNVTDISMMFYEAKSFNQSLKYWNVRNVANMDGMFHGATTFNQPIGDWDVVNVTSMYSMFNGASSFNQSLNNWNVRNVTNMYNMFNSSSLSTSNYDSTLIGWSEHTVQPDVELGAEGIHYCNGWYARMKLKANFNWSFNDAGFTNCFFTSNHDQNKTMSIDDPKNQLDISIYPNPTSGMVYIEGNYTQLKVVVYDLLGKQLINKSITNHIDLSHLENGIYLLQFSDGMKLFTQRIVKN